LTQVQRLGTSLIDCSFNKILDPLYRIFPPEKCLVVS
jgi:hypothetical protein